MSTLVLISGYSGSGKSTSMRNMDWNSTFVIKPNGKPFPFKSKGMKPWDAKTKSGQYMETTDYAVINAVLQKLPEYGKKSINF